MSSIEETAFENLRFVSHVEDDPAVWHAEFGSYEEAAEACKSMVLTRLHQNGCGDGLVFDRVEDKVVAVFRHDHTSEINSGPLTPPSLVEREELTQAFRPWLKSSSRGHNPDLIWRTFH